jgi:Kef-type K+ transport system membrane component KefB
MDNLFWIGLLLILGYMAGIISNRFRLPKVSGYILVGILLSPSFSHILPQSFLSSTEGIVHFSLAVIAFLIGGSLKYQHVKKLKTTILSVMFSASEMTFVVVSVGLFFILPSLSLPALAFESYQEYLFTALFLGAIGAATAPAEVLAVIHQYKAKGPLTTTLLGVVATDDAAALINFSLVLSLASLMQGNSDTTLGWSLLELFWMIFLSVLLGLVAGWLQSHHIKGLNQESSLMISTFGSLLIIYTLAHYFGLDGLLTCMAYGVSITNLSTKSDAIFKVIQMHFEEIIFVLFFIISGASIELEVLAVVWPIALLYVVLRMIGKIGGSWFGATLSKADPIIKKYAGIGQMPQTGVAIGLALILYHNPDFTGIGSVVLNTIIAATAINAVIGPYLLKKVLYKANEAREKE